MIKAIIFDADNTLYMVKKDSAYRVMFAVLEKETGKSAEVLGVKWKEIIKDVFESESSRNLELRKREYSIQRLLEKSGMSDKAMIKRITGSALSAFWKQIISDLEFDKELKKTLVRLKKKYLLAVASDEFRKPLELKLNHILGNWNEYFEFLVSAEDAGELKPSEKFYLRALEKLKAAPGEILVVGDSWTRDLEPAKKSGLKTVLVAEKQEGKPDFFIRKIHELKELGF